jgi:F-type H+-transporting ATPase subunit epsilon
LQNGNVEQRFMVAGGFAEVTPERCTVLADEATPFEQVTAEQLAERQRVAERDLVDAATDAEKAAAQKALSVAKDLQRAQAFYAGR